MKRNLKNLAPEGAEFYSLKSVSGAVVITFYRCDEDDLVYYFTNSKWVQMPMMERQDLGDDFHTVDEAVPLWLLCLWAFALGVAIAFIAGGAA